MSYPCLSCGNNVTNRQEAISCDGCERWCHRKCGTGISRQEYRAAIREDREINYTCHECSHTDHERPLHQSTPLHGKFLPISFWLTQYVDGTNVMYFILIHFSLRLLLLSKIDSSCLLLFQQKPSQIYPWMRTIVMMVSWPFVGV